MMTTAEKIVSRAVLDALTRTVWTVTVDGDAETSHAVLLTATPSNDGRSIAVRVEPFDGDEIAEVQVLVSPARLVHHDTEQPATATASNGSGPVDPVVAEPDGSPA